jgi:predicted secreted Zn-dependent protease
MKASNEVSQIWDKWYPHLIKHEKGHQKISIEIAEKIEEGIFNLPEYSSCEKLESQANSLGEKLIRKHDVMNKAFDGNTNHGETEGAWINPYL